MLAVLAGETSIAEAARKEEVSDQSISRWKAEFVEGAGKTALAAGKSGPSTREEQLGTSSDQPDRTNQHERPDSAPADTSWHRRCRPPDQRIRGSSPRRCTLVGGGSTAASTSATGTCCNA
jgi:transposase-like protein